MKPVGFLLSGSLFTLQPEQYLFQAESKCYFVLNECKLSGKNKDIYIMGDAFLKHYYSAFDFDKNEILLGINTHSKDLVKMETAKAPEEKKEE